MGQAGSRAVYKGENMILKTEILETERLYLRELVQSDYPALCTMLQDPSVMYAYEHAFGDQEAQGWLDRQMDRYREHGFGLWAVIRKDTEALIGQCGLTLQDYDGRQVMEVGYLFQKAVWHQGYAAEAAIACRNYAFDRLDQKEVYSIIRDTNTPSIRVAERNGMTLCGRFTKHYYHMDMPHLVYCIRREER